MYSIEECSAIYQLPVPILGILLYSGSIQSSLQFIFAHTGGRLPTFIRTPKDTHVFVGGNFSLTCSADEVTEGYQWTKDDDIISENARVQIHPGRRLTVVNATKRDAGVYHCLAINEEGSVNASAIVNVTGAVLTCDGM